MKYNRIKLKLFFLLSVSMLFVLSGCSDDIELGSADEGRYELQEEVYGHLNDKDGHRSMSTIDYREEGSAELFVTLLNAAESDVKVKFHYDRLLVKQYNDKYDTKYSPFSKENVTFANEGEVTIAKGENVSQVLNVSFSTSPDVTPGATFVIPIRAEVVSGNVVMTKSSSEFLLFVRDMKQLDKTEKTPAVKIFSCMEVNDTNPLNNLCFKLKNSDKYVIDAVILFSSNINMDRETNRVVVTHNPNVRHILDNKDKYLKPLKDAGMKVILSILGNHDEAGIAGLSDETARYFAQELKATCEAYDLDGVFFDDEYSRYSYDPKPGLVRPSTYACSRLMYETKMAMPDKWIIAYVYGTTGSASTIDGTLPGDYIDYALHDYGGGSALDGRYPGLDKSGWGMFSSEYNQGRFASSGNLARLRTEGYGAHMIFAMDPLRSNFASQLSAGFGRIATSVYEDEVVYDGKPFPKDW